jgi:hypothetical protein
MTELNTSEQLETLIDAMNTMNIALFRLYDVQMAQLALISDRAADEVERFHSEGRFIGPRPMIIEKPFEDPPGSAVQGE